MSILLSLALAASLQTTQPAAREAVPAPPVVATEEDDPRICRREHAVGSNRPQRICMKKSEWDRIRQSAREDRRRNDELNRGGQNPMGSPSGA